MSFVKKLAGETLIYGMSSILPRIIHYVVFTIYITRKFEDQLQYGIYSTLYAYSSILLVLFLFRMDTAFFRYGSRKEYDQASVFSSGLIPVGFIALTGVGLLFLGADAIAGLIKYEGSGYYVRWFAVIIGFDAIAGMFYAKFRLQSRPMRFLFYRLLNIVVTIGLVLVFLEVFPRIGWRDVLPVKEPIDYVFIANLVASGTVVLLMLPEIVKTKVTFNLELWKKMLWYSFPLVIVGIAGNINQTFSAPLMHWFLGDDYDANLTVAGAYNGPAKIAILLNLFAVAFNYAAEPFFFNNAEKKESGEAYGQIAHAFAVTAVIVMVGIVAFQEAVILIVGENYRGPQDIIPILLFSYLFLGLYYNVSIWYKLSDKTIYGAVIGVTGAVITLVISMIFLPRLGYIASAWASLACFGTMLMMGYFLGQKHYPIRYPVRDILFILVVTLVTIVTTIYAKSFLSGDIAKVFLGMFIFVLFLGILYLTQGKGIKKYLNKSI